MLQQLDLFFAKKSLRPQAQNEEQIFFRDTKIEVQRRAYQRSLNLLVRPNGALKVTAGRTVPAKVIQNFLLKNAEWIEKHLSQFEQLRRKYPPKLYREGEGFLFKGQVKKLAFADSLSKKSTVEEVDQHLLVRAPCGRSLEPAQTRKLVREFYEGEGRKLLAETIEKRSEEMQLFPRKLEFRSMKAQWGSCSTQGRICLNWRLVVFPQELCNYVVVHELAHLKHPNHSASFWRLVEEHVPNYKVYRRYLADHHYEVDFLARKSDLYFE